MDDKRYNRCLAIREMMKNPLWEEAVMQVNNDIQREAMATKPEEKRLREDLYSEHVALGRLLGRLYELGNEATVIEEKVERVKQHVSQ